MAGQVLYTLNWGYQINRSYFSYQINVDFELYGNCGGGHMTIK